MLEIAESKGIDDCEMESEEDENSESDYDEEKARGEEVFKEALKLCQTNLEQLDEFDIFREGFHHLVNPH